MTVLGEQYAADIVADDLYLIEEGKPYAWTTMLKSKGLRYRKPAWISLEDFVRHDLGPVKPLLRLAFLRQHGIGYDETLRTCEDWAFYMECLLHGARFLIAPVPGYAYRMRPGSLSRSVLTLLDYAERNLQKYIADPRLQGREEVLRLLKEKLREVRSNRRYYSVMAPLKERNFRQAVRTWVRTPEFPLLFVARIPRILSYRVRRRMVRLRLGGGQG
ncbi:MAG: hypothetical protein ABDI20_09110 [Candidatus Bipolaricaulaceae bacterium]